MGAGSLLIKWLFETGPALTCVYIGPNEHSNTLSCLQNIHMQSQAHPHGHANLRSLKLLSANAQVRAMAYRTADLKEAASVTVDPQTSSSYT